jgi:hypothetical protein
MIEYILISFLYLLGLGFHAMKKVTGIKEKYPDAGFGAIWATYFKSEWNTLIVASLGLFTINMLWFILHHEEVKLPGWVHDYGGVYILSLFSGYWLHMGIYKILGTLEKKADQRFGDKTN